MVRTRISNALVAKLVPAAGLEIASGIKVGKLNTTPTNTKIGTRAESGDLQKKRPPPFLLPWFLSRGLPY